MLSAGPNLKNRPRAARNTPIRIVNYDPRWRNVFQQEMPRVLRALQAAGLGSHLVGPEHIGSTSVPGMGAKPVVDMMVGVKRPLTLESFPRGPLARLGYRERPFKQQGTGLVEPSRLLFTRYSQPEVNLHVFPHGSTHWRGHMAVRDYLRTYPGMAATYRQLKSKLAARSDGDLSWYTLAKRPFLNALQTVALAAARRGGRQPSKGEVMMRRKSTSSRLAIVQPRPSGAPNSVLSPAGGGARHCGVWYQMKNGRLTLSHDQNPAVTKSAGTYLTFDGRRWHTITNGSSSSAPSRPPSSKPHPLSAETWQRAPGTGLKPARKIGSAAKVISRPAVRGAMGRLAAQIKNTQDAAPYPYTPPSVSQGVSFTWTRANGTKWTEDLWPPDTSEAEIAGNSPSNAYVSSNDEGWIVVYYNQDGSAWDDDTSVDPGGNGVSVTFTRQDGSTWTMDLWPPDSQNVYEPPGSQKVVEPDGWTQVYYNQDGSPWTGDMSKSTDVAPTVGAPEPEPDPGQNPEPDTNGNTGTDDTGDDNNYDDTPQYQTP